MFKNSSKLYLYLHGGLGNQMFQYAAARSLSIRLGLNLVLDTWSGFVRDVQYRRNYELGSFPVKGRRALPWELLSIWLYRWTHRNGRNYKPFHKKYWFGEFIFEVPRCDLEPLNGVNISYTYHSNFKKILPRGSFWFIGYWQSPLYFEEIASTLLEELMPPTPSKKYFNLGKTMQSIESVALGIRFYEESKNPGSHTLHGNLKNIEEIQGAIERFRLKCPNARFYLFCTHRSPIFECLQLPNDTVYVTKDDGYTNSIETLWLLTRCRHHIFTNSTYYWWGAWLSSKVRGNEKQHIIAADNFINHDGLCASWEQF